ncbi:MAG: DUF432 domain-containing protein [Archaeoglobaceae archaeon]
MFGRYTLNNFSISLENFRAEIKKFDNTYIYLREGSERVEKAILGDAVEIVVNPVEPVNLPKNITNYLMIEFRRKILLEPGREDYFYVTFPIEIGVFVVKSKEVGLVDIFSFLKPKYTLYGSPDQGVICRYWLSEVYDRIPELDKVREGIVELRITNQSEKWVEISKVVFDVYTMHIYYNDRMSFASAYMKVLSSKLAEAEFLESSFEGERSIELYTTKAFQVVGRKFVMEWGI